MSVRPAPTMSPLCQIESTDAHSIIALRRSILRPNSPDTSWCDYHGDREEDALHLRAVCEGRAVGMITCVRERIERNQFEAVWRIRGLGVVEQLRGAGLGRSLLSRLLGELGEQRLVDGVWLSGRSGRQTFYEQFSFIPCSPEYMVAGTGPHYDFVLSRAS